LLRTGCQWRQLPADFPPWPTVHGYFRRWRMSGVWTRLHRTLYPQARSLAGRKPGPTLGIMDGQSVKTTERGCSWLRRSQAGQRTQTPYPGGCARHPNRHPSGGGKHLRPCCWFQIARWTGAALANHPLDHRGCWPREPQAWTPCGCRIAPAGRHGSARTLLGPSFPS
jgi:hypothetical protein